MSFPLRNACSKAFKELRHFSPPNLPMGQAEDPSIRAWPHLGSGPTAPALASAIPSTWAPSPSCLPPTLLSLRVLLKSPLFSGVPGPTGNSTRPACLTHSEPLNTHSMDPRTPMAVRSAGAPGPRSTGPSAQMSEEQQVLSHYLLREFRGASGQDRRGASPVGAWRQPDGSICHVAHRSTCPDAYSQPSSTLFSPQLSQMKRLRSKERRQLNHV